MIQHAMLNKGLMLSTLFASMEASITVADAVFFPLMNLAGNVVVMVVISIH